MLRKVLKANGTRRYLIIPFKLPGKRLYDASGLWNMPLLLPLKGILEAHAVQNGNIETNHYSY